MFSGFGVEAIELTDLPGLAEAGACSFELEASLAKGALCECLLDYRYMQHFLLPVLPTAPPSGSW